jgi:hypothetical protein
MRSLRPVGRVPQRPDPLVDPLNGRVFVCPNGSKKRPQLREARGRGVHPDLCVSIVQSTRQIKFQIRGWFSDPFVRTLSGGQEVASGFSGTFAGDLAEAFGTSLIGNRSLSFRATLKRLADN